jgi:hypothetical protein
MAEAARYVYSYKEIAEALVKQQGIHEGLWGIYMEFGIAGANISPGPSEDQLVPAAIVPILKVGLQRFEKPSALTVDAAEVNPPAHGRPKSAERKRQPA